MALEKKLNRLINVAFVDNHIICKAIRVFYSAMENTKVIIQAKNGKDLIGTAKPLLRASKVINPEFIFLENIIAYRWFWLSHLPFYRNRQLPPGLISGLSECHVAVSARRKYPEVQICQYIKRSIYATDNH